ITRSIRLVNSSETDRHNGLSEYRHSRLLERLPPVALTGFRDDCVRIADPRHDGTEKLLSLRTADEKPERANDPRDAQMIVIGWNQPMVILGIKPGHALCRTAQV